MHTSSCIGGVLTSRGGSVRLCLVALLAAALICCLPQVGAAVALVSNSASCGLCAPGGGGVLLLGRRQGHWCNSAASVRLVELWHWVAKVQVAGCAGAGDLLPFGRRQGSML
jgi:hypothetical protein